MNTRWWLLLSLVLCLACESGSEEGMEEESAAAEEMKGAAEEQAEEMKGAAEEQAEEMKGAAEEQAEEMKGDTEGAASSELMTDEVAPYECGRIRNVHTYQGIVFAGQPSAEDLQLVKDTGVMTVFNLRHREETPDLDEEQVVTDLGMQYVHLPFRGPDELTDEVFDRAREILKTAERPMLFHCGSANRVGALWLPYRVLEGGISIEEALAEAKTIGLRAPAYEEKALDYVKRKQN